MSDKTVFPTLSSEVTVVCFYILCSTLYTISVLCSPPAHVISVAMYTDGSLVADCGFTDNIVQCVCVCVCVSIHNLPL